MYIHIYIYIYICIHIYIYILIGALEHLDYFSIYWEFHDPKRALDFAGLVMGIIPKQPNFTIQKSELL